MAWDEEQRADAADMEDESGDASNTGLNSQVDQDIIMLLDNLETAGVSNEPTSFGKVREHNKDVYSNLYFRLVTALHFS